MGASANRRTSGATSTRRVRRLGVALDAVRENCDAEARRDADPVGFVHRFTTAEEQELAGLVCAAMAFGNVTALRAKLEELFGRLGVWLDDGTAKPGALIDVADQPALVRRLLKPFKHRVYRGDDIARLIIGARGVQRDAGSLGSAFEEELRNDRPLADALSSWAERIRAAGGLGRERAGQRHILPDARAGSAAKRLVLYLRWMVRPADGVDLGLWNIPPARLVMPLDTHIHKLGTNLGLITIKTASWRAAEQITDVLRGLDPNDPVKYDFALCHLGMLQSCPSRRDPVRCKGCGIRSVCVHWARKPPTR